MRDRSDFADTKTISQSLTAQGLALSLLMILVAAISACQKQEAAQPVPRTVMVAQPQQAGVTQNSYSGEVRARQETDLSFRVGGKITRRLVEVGDRVSSNQVLAKLDPTDANLQLGAARAQLDSALSAERTLKADLERYRQLLPSNAISRSQFDQIENQYKTARSNVQQAQANLEVVSNQASYATLSSNKSGVIVARNIEVGQVVSAGQSVYRLAIDGEREVVFGVPEQVIDQFKLRQSVQVSLWSSPDQRLAAYVREIAPAADASRTFAVRVAFNNPQAPVKIGQSARVFVSSTQHDTALQVPLAAITAEQQNSYVLVFNPANATLMKKPVQIGAYGRDSVPVLDGLNSQDWVVIGGVHLLQAGQKVQAVDRDNQPVTSKAATNHLATNQAATTPPATAKKD